MIRVTLNQNGATVAGYQDWPHSKHQADTWLIREGRLQIVHNDTVISEYAAGTWVSVHALQKAAILDIEGYGSFGVPNSHAKEIWNELGRALNEANDAEQAAAKDTAENGFAEERGYQG